VWLVVNNRAEPIRRPKPNNHEFFVIAQIAGGKQSQAAANPAFLRKSSKNFWSF
jgi:hypothetical protein